MHKLTDIQIETTNYCNLQCSFCPHSRMKRPLGFMPIGLFNKIIDNCIEIQPKNIYLFLNGEPFTDIRIYDFVQIIVDQLPESKPILYSNLQIPLDIQQIDKLRPAHIVLSTSEWVDIKAVENNLNLLKEHNIIPKMHTIVEQKVMERGFTIKAKHNLDWTLTRKYNWHGLINSFTKAESDVICYRPAMQICILIDGSVSLCCMDVEGEIILGDANKYTLLNIYNNDLSIKYRTTTKSELEFCKNCNM